MADSMKQMLSKSIGLSEQVIKSANEATFFKENCYEIKSQTEMLSALFHRMMDNASSKLYERPAIRIINDTQQVLEKALSLILSCRGKSFIGRKFSFVSVADFRKISSLLECSIGDFKGLLGVWGMIATLNNGSLNDKSEAVASLLGLARDSDRNRKVIVEEGGIKPLLKLLREGKIEDQKNVAKAIGVMGSDPESVERMIQTGVCTVCAKILKEGHMEVQPVVAWAVSEFAANYSTCQDIFAQHNVVRLLINHLTSGVVLEDVPNVIVINKATSTLAIVMARNHLNTSKAIEEYDDGKPNQPQQKNVSISGTSFKGGEVEVEVEDPETKAHMKEMAARALCNLLKGNSSICRMIVESRALMGFVALLDKGKVNVQFHSAMALMEITAVAEQDSDLRRSTFRHNSPACKIVVDQVVKVLERENSQKILIPCIKAIGNLAKTFRVSETRIIAPLVKFLELEERTDVEVSREATIALTKFVCKENYLHLEHSKTIIQAGAARHLIQLVYFGEQIDQVSALLLFCYIALHVPDSKELIQNEVLTVLEWASKQSYLIQDEKFKSLLPEAKSRLERFQFSTASGVHTNRIELETQAGKKSFTVKEIIDATGNFSPRKKIGKDGRFGIVYKAELPNLTVAVKKLFPQSKGAKQIGTEVYARTVIKLEHENLVQLLATYSRKDLQLLIYEYMGHGSLEQALFDPKSSTQLSWETRYRICLQIAQGLEYLHAKNPPIIHRDIKASNILLDGNSKAKISDFGSARLYEEDNPFMFIEESGARMYMAPEYAIHKDVTVAVDVFSFGVLLLEIVSGIKNDKNLSKHHDQIFFLLDKVAILHAMVKHEKLQYKKVKYAELVDEKLLNSTYSEEEVVIIIDLAILCTNQMAFLRPAISDVISVLKGEKTVDDVSKNKVKDTSSA